MTLERGWQLLKNMYHWFQAHMWRLYYGRPDLKLKLYGVTGTNGKTTTAIFLGSILREAYGSQKVGLITTEVFWFGDEEQSNATHMTSVNARLVFRYLKKMVDAGATHAVMEMTSHALDQHRMAGITLEGAIFLNVRHEHLDYHKTMADYAKAKARIANYVRLGGVIVANKDEEWVRKSLDGKKNIVWFTGNETKDIAVVLPGDFNKENALAAILLAEKNGVARDVAEKGVLAVKSVPGRMEWVEVPNGARVLIDFALTPYAYERIFKFLRSETAGKLIAVFGAAGRRDKEKRPIISRIVSEYADEIVITQDEPYDDPEEEIYSQLEAGLEKSSVKWQRIEDRREAIAYALMQAGPEDVVAITGMGNYDTRIVGDVKVPWNDRSVVEELILSQKVQ